MILFVRSPRTGRTTRGPALIAAACLLASTAGTALAQQQKPGQRAAAPAARIGEVAGRYAVLREEGKDTLCMVTLSETARGSGYYRAQLAPACRDNGIVIFDPIAWTLDRQGHISLQARKGHKMSLEKDANGVWQRLGGDAKARPLALRRI